MNPEGFETVFEYEARNPYKIKAVFVLDNYIKNNPYISLLLPMVRENVVCLKMLRPYFKTETAPLVLAHKQYHNAPNNSYA